MWIRFWLCFLAMMVAATPALAQENRVTIKGRPVVLDGETLLFPAVDLSPLPEGYALTDPNVVVRVRLWGIDAPDMQDWPFGAHARGELADFVRDKNVTCVVVGEAETFVDVFTGKIGIGQVIAHCSAFSTQIKRQLDLGQMMLGSGWAIHQPLAITVGPEDLARTYESLEFLARDSGFGMWAKRQTDPTANLELVGTGTGIAVTLRGHVVTNNHVVEGCTETRVRPRGLPSVVAPRAFVDPNNDLAVLVAGTEPTEIATFRSGRPTRQGDQAVVFGFPLSGALSSQGNLTVGFISALTGLRDDSRVLQISAPVQPGNSGGPLLDMSGNVVGVVTAKIDAIKVAELIGDIPQNVNFAIKASVVRAFLDSHDVNYRTESSDRVLSAADVADRAKKFTVLVECWR